MDKKWLDRIDDKTLMSAAKTVLFNRSLDKSPYAFLCAKVIEHKTLGKTVSIDYFHETRVHNIIFSAFNIDDLSENFENPIITDRISKDWFLKVNSLIQNSDQFTEEEKKQYLRDCYDHYREQIVEKHQHMYDTEQQNYQKELAELNEKINRLNKEHSRYQNSLVDDFTKNMSCVEKVFNEQIFPLANTNSSKPSQPVSSDEEPSM